MKYIFNKNNSSEYQRGEFPIEIIHLCWYDMDNNNECYDEAWVDPKNFRANYLTYLEFP